MISKIMIWTSQIGSGWKAILTSLLLYWQLKETFHRMSVITIGSENLIKKIRVFLLKWTEKSKCFKLICDAGPYHIETILLICSSNQWTGFFMIGTSVMK